MFEVGFPAVVRVGQFLIRTVTRVRKEQRHAVAMRMWRTREQCTQVDPIHHEQVGMALEIGAADLARTMIRQGIAARRGTGR